MSDSEDRNNLENTPEQFGGARRSADELSADVASDYEKEFDVVEIDDEVLDQTSNKSYSQGQLVLRRFLRHRAAMISLMIFLFIVVFSFSSIGFGGIPGWWKWNYTDPLPVINDGHPTWHGFSFGEHPFGQPESGQDYFALVMRGAQRSIIIALTVGVVATVVGTLIGALAGYYRGWLEAILMRLTDMFIIIPMLIVAAVIGKITGSKGIMVLAVMLGLLSWTGLARLVRGEVLSLREREFVVAARALGSSSLRIIFKHILPNCLGTIIVNATLAVASAIILESSLSFLGFGVRAPDTSLGLLISKYQTTLDTRPWLFFGASSLILIISLAVNFIGDGLRDAFDPRQKGKVS